MMSVWPCIVGLDWDGVVIELSGVGSGMDVDVVSWLRRDVKWSSEAVKTEMVD